jgi:hypothetical protein
MNAETQKINGVHLPFMDLPRPQSDAWMFSANPASDKRRKVRLRITPSLARLWLDNANKCNRHISDFSVMQYACDMRDGRWEDNGDSLRFNLNGDLIDGQHRLLAVIECGIPLEADVVFGLSPKAKGTIDIGRVRSAADIAHFDGMKNTTNACALAYMLLIHRKYGIHRMNNTELKPTKTQVVAAVKDDPRISEVAGQSSAWGRSLVAPRIVNFCHYLFSEQHRHKANQFFSGLVTGTGLDATSPIYQLRERLILNKAAKAKLPPLEIIALFFKAWVAYRSGRQVKALRWRTAGPKPEPFPEI